MNADHLQTMVARSLVDPGFLAEALDHETARWADIETIEALRLFRGFIARIKHTGLRRIVPLTLRLLHAHRLEIAFFSAHAPAHLTARSNGPIPPPQLFEQFEEALHAYLPGLGEDARIAVTAMLRHEGQIWRMRGSTAVMPDTAGPRLAEGTAILRYPIDVLRLSADLARDAHVVPLLRHGDQCLLYRAQHGVRIDTIDLLSACVLSGLDGRRTRAQVCDDAAAALGSGAGPLIGDLLDQAAAQGIVALPVDTGSG